MYDENGNISADGHYDATGNLVPPWRPRGRGPCPPQDKTLFRAEKRAQALYQKAELARRKRKRLNSRQVPPVAGPGTRKSMYELLKDILQKGA